jgi:hypothetical protein
VHVLILDRETAKVLLDATFAGDIRTLDPCTEDAAWRLLSKVLSATCDDGKLGENDKYAVEFGRTFEANRVEPLPSAFLVGNLDGEMLAKFALAVPWRASISARLAQSCSQRNDSERSQNISINDPAWSDSARPRAAYVFRAGPPSHSCRTRCRVFAATFLHPGRPADPRA